MDIATRLIDRITALVPLGVLLYVLRRNAADRHELLEALERNSAAARDRERELLNRITHPHLMPTGTRRDERSREDIEAAARATIEAKTALEAQAAATPEELYGRGAWNGLGTAARHFPWPTTSEEE